MQSKGPDLPRKAGADVTTQSRRRFAGVRARLVFLALVSLLPLAATMLYLANETRRLAMHEAGDRLNTLVRFVAAELSEAGAAARQLTLALAQGDTALRIGGPSCSRQLARIAAQHRIYAHLFTTDPLGQLVCSSLPLAADVSIADRGYFPRAMGSVDPVMGEIVLSRASGRHSLTFAVAMRDDDGPAGIVGASVDLMGFLQELDRTYGEMLPGAVLTIWNGEGEVVARVPDPEGMVGTRGVDSPLYRAMSGHGLRPGQEELRGLDGVLRQYAFTGYGPAEARVWISAGIPRARLLADARQVFYGSLVAILLVSVVSLALAWLIGERSLIRPVRRLTAAARKLERGDLGVRVGQVGGAVEIAGLGEAFDGMVGALLEHERERDVALVELEQARDRLESTVRLRTAQLSTAIGEAEEKAESLEKLRYEDELLNEMSGMLQACHGIEEALPVVARCLPQLFPERPGHLFVMQDSDHALIAAVSWGERCPGEAAVFAPADCWALRLGQSFRYEHDGRRPPCRHAGQPRSGYKCIPLQSQGKTLGVLQVTGEHATLSRSLAQTAADRIALAIGNIKLRESLLNLSIRDALTGLYNRRYVDETLGREAHRCQRLGKSLSVLMLDVDHFKRFNDNFGHDAGDAVLRAIGAQLTQGFRGSDIACRLGGEEFLVILPEAAAEHAAAKAEELRGAVQALDLRHDGKPLGSVTVSVGVATFPLPVGQLEELLGAADAALYQAKREGRNRVCAAR